jgi:hypothetical protein
MRTTHDEEIIPHPCIYCGGLTSENYDLTGGNKDYWHTDCESLSALMMEEAAQQKLREHPDSPTLQFLAEVCEHLADRVCAKR